MTNKLNPQGGGCNEAESPKTLTVASARETILASSVPVSGIEKLALRDALGRALAQDIVSPVNVPGHTNSAMDGYAISGNDLPGDETTGVQGHSHRLRWQTGLIVLWNRRMRSDHDRRPHACWH